MLAVDSNILIYSADAGSARCSKAREFLRHQASNSEFVLCELNLIELYMALRNPAIFEKPQDARGAFEYCDRLRSNDLWQVVDYVPEVGKKLWDWAARTKGGFRKIIDARIAFALLHHGVTEFATTNTKDFEEFEFERLWNPLQ